MAIVMINRTTSARRRCQRGRGDKIVGDKIVNGAMPNLQIAERQVLRSSIHAGSL